MSSRLWVPPKPLKLLPPLAKATVALLGAILLVPCSFARPLPETSRFLAFVVSTRVLMPIGVYDQKTGWKPFDQVYVPYEQKDPFTLYGMGGKVAEVEIDDLIGRKPDDPPLNWSPSLTRWNFSPNEYALGVAGRNTLVAGGGEELSKEDPELRKSVAEYLKRYFLKVPEPLITQAYRLPLNSRGEVYEFVCAHSDESKLKDQEPAQIYAVALVRRQGEKEWKTLGKEVSRKPTKEPLEEHDRQVGRRAFYRFLAAVDITGDGAKEVVLYKAHPEGTTIDVFERRAKTLKQVLSVFKHNFQ